MCVKSQIIHSCKCPKQCTLGICKDVEENKDCRRTLIDKVVVVHYNCDVCEEKEAVAAAAAANSAAQARKMQRIACGRA